MSVRVIAIDWSGALDHPERKIWCTELSPGIEPQITNGLTREEIFDYLLQRTNDSSPTIIGLDFAFSCPAWFVKEQGCNSAMEFWGIVEQEGENWLKNCPFPFWGRYKVKRCPLERNKFFRKTEQNQSVGGIVAKSVFQLAGSGHVGTGSLRGMPFLKQFKEHGFSIWPFDAPGLRTVIEIYPRLLTGKVNKRNTESRVKYLAATCFSSFSPGWRERAASCEDAFDAAVSACRMHECHAELNALKRVDDPEILLEGMIWTPKKAAE